MEIKIYTCLIIFSLIGFFINYFIYSFYLNNINIQKYINYKYKNLFLIEMITLCLLSPLVYFNIEVFYFILVLMLITLSFIDFHEYIVPDGILIVGLVAGLLLNYNTIYFSFLGMIVGGVPLLIVIKLSDGGMGYGDMKLLCVIGAFVGAKLVFLSLISSIVIGGIFSILGILFNKLTLKSKIPFVPFISIGTYLVLILQGYIFNFIYGIY